MAGTRAPALYQSLLDLSGEVLLALDLDRQLVIANSGLARALGTTIEALHGKPLLSLVWQDDRALVDAKLEQLFSLGGTLSFDCRMCHSDGPPLLIGWSWTVSVIHQIFLGRGALVDSGDGGCIDHSAWAALTEKVDDPVLLVDAEGIIRFASPGLKRLLGLSPDELRGESLTSIAAPSESSRLKELLRNSTRRRDAVHIDSFDFHVRGGGALTSEALVVNRLANPTLRGLVVTLKRRKVRSSEARPRRDTVKPSISTWSWDLATDTVHLSQSIRGSLGLSSRTTELPFGEWIKRVHPDERPTVENHLRTLIKGDVERVETHHRVQHADASYRWLYHDLHRQFDATGETTLIKSLVCGPSSERGVDPLTGLPNRNYVTGKLYDALTTLRERPDFRFALMSIDLDRFKTVNDSLGRRFGDELLQVVSQRIRRCLAPADVLARFGADEFGVLLENLRDLDEARRVAERIQVALSHPFPMQGKSVFTSASIGIAPSDRSYPDPEEILRAARLAMQTSKREPKRTPATFRTEMSMQAINLFHLAADLRVAIEKEEFVLHYQPIINIESGAILGFEALVRWEHPRRGLLGPGAFIPFAEEEGLIAPISWWVIDAACRQVHEWHRTVPELAQALMSVNLSGKLFEGSGLVERIDEVLDNTSVRSSSLLLEITESAMIQNPERTCEIMGQLRDRGMLIAVDDFGTGYSSLSYLFRFPVAGLKIDKSFVSQMVGAASSMEVVRTILLLAKNLKMFVIAEGVETDLHLQLLHDLECKLAQGFYFAKPMSAADVMRWISQRGAVT